MPHFLVAVLCLSLFVNFIPDPTERKAGVKVISFADFEEMIKRPSNKLVVYNFWATWCAPCVKEMPAFEKVNAEDAGIELVFVSLDDGRKPERVNTFIERRGIKAPVFLLDDADVNSWKGKVNTGWSGAIPATLFVKSDGSRAFHEGELSEAELKDRIRHLAND